LKSSNNNDYILRQKKREALLYSIGDEYASIVSDETDALLEEYSNIEVPESLDKWVSGLREKSELNERKEQLRRRVSKIGKRAAIIVVVFSLLTTAATLSVEAFRIKLFNMIIEVSEKFSFIHFGETNAVDLADKLPADWDSCYPTVLPDGYEFKSAFAGTDFKYIIFENRESKEIYFSQSDITHESQLDTEDAEVAEIEINGMEGLTVVKGDYCIVYWHDNSKLFYLDGYAGKSVLLKVAESIIEK